MIKLRYSRWINLWLCRGTVKKELEKKTTNKKYVQITCTPNQTGIQYLRKKLGFRWKTCLVFRKVILRTTTFYGNKENATNSVYFRCKYVYNLRKNMATTLKFENCRLDVARSVFLCNQWNCLTVQPTYAGNTDAYPIRNTGPIPGSCSICPHQWSDAPITQGCPPCVQWIIII